MLLDALDFIQSFNCVRVSTPLSCLRVKTDCNVIKYAINFKPVCVCSVSYANIIFFMHIDARTLFVDGVCDFVIAIKASAQYVGYY